MTEIQEELKDFRNFLYVTWKHLGLPDPTPVQYDIAEYLQHGPRRRMVQAFRGVGKSWITSAFVLWTLYLDPEKKVLVVSASKSRADDFSTFCHRLVREMPVLKHLIPNEDQRTSKIAWDVGPTSAAHSPSCKSVGITGQLTGSRADLIVADDVEVPGNSSTVGARSKLADSVKEFEAIIKPEVGEIVFLGTPQSQESIYTELSARNYDVRIYPARIPDDEKIYEGMLAEYVNDLEGGAGTPTDPDRFSDEELQDREASYGRTGFQLQFQLDVRLSDLDRYPLRISDLIVMDTDPLLGPEKIVWGTQEEWIGLPNLGFKRDKFYRPQRLVGEIIPYSGSVMAIDPSGRGKDETAWAIVKYLNGYLYLVDWGGTTEGFTEPVMRGLATYAKQYEVNLILTESNYGGGMFSELLKPHLHELYPCTIEEVTAMTHKEKRIADTLEPVMNQHRLCINAEAIKKDYNQTLMLPPDIATQYSLMYQLSHLTREKRSLDHDDKLDAVAMAVAYWAESMAKNADEAIKDRRDGRLQDELDKMFDILAPRNGREHRSDGWFDV